MVGTVQEREKELADLYPFWEPDSQWTWFEKNSRRFAKKVFLTDEDQCITYQEMRDQILAAADGLFTLGVRAGMMAAVDMVNRKELVEAVFALSRLGCTTVMVNAKIADSEREYILKKAEVQILLSDRNNLPVTRQMERGFQEPEVTWTGDFRKENIRWEHLKKTSCEAATAETPRPDPERTSMIMFTSGSTSHPKGVMLTDNMLLRSAFATANTRHMEPGRKIYLPIPLFHAMAYVEGMLAAAMVGGSIVISKKKYTPLEHLNRIRECGANDIVCIASIMIRMMTESSEKSMEFPHLHAAYWAGVCPAWVWKQATQFFQIRDLGNGYGMTECGSTSHIMSGTDPEEKIPFCHGKLKRAGAAADPKGSDRILTMKIVSEDGKQECRPGMAGEILFRGIAVTKGYYKDPEHTAASLDSDGWLHSGDLGMLDEQGYLIFLGRKDDQFKVNGENVSPQFVEEVLLQHENVRYAEVVGVSHERCGEAGAAFLEFVEERDDAITELQTYIREKLARFQQPEWIFSMKSSDWPKTSSGKVSKQKLRELAENMKNK